MPLNCIYFVFSKCSLPFKMLGKLAMSIAFITRVNNIQFKLQSTSHVPSSNFQQSNPVCIVKRKSWIGEYFWLRRRSPTSPNVFCLCVCVPQIEILPSYSIRCDSVQFQNVLEFYRMFKNVPECSRMFQNVPECMQYVPESSRMFWNASYY